MKSILTVCFTLAAALCMHAQPGIIIPEPPHPMPRPNPRPNPGLFELQLRQCKVEADITGISATTQLEQVFYNPTDFAWQGYYLYPLPGVTAVKKFSMFVNGKEIEAELLDAARARELYEGIVRKFQDPAILEYYQFGALKMKIFPVPPRSEVRIRLSYVHTLSKDNGLTEYSLPFKQKELVQTTAGEVSFRIRINQPEEIKHIYCPTHTVEINRINQREATVGFEQKNYRSDQDFRLFLLTQQNKIGATLMTFNDETEDGYFYLDLSPGFVTKENTTDKDIVFVVDASGSMAGDNMEQAKRSLLFCINQLNPGDRFNIVRFSTEAASLYDALQPADPAHLEKARDYISQLKAMGGTNMEDAFDKAFSARGSAGRPYFIVFLTDGKPTIGETMEEPLIQKIKSKNEAHTRIYTLGIGTDLNTHLLDRLTEMTRAFRTYILPNEDIEIKISEFYNKVSSPVLTDITLKTEGMQVYDMYPKALPDLFAGSSLGLYGRYKGNGPARIILTGKVNGREETHYFPLNFEKRDVSKDFIPPLWATRAVGYLLDQIRLNGENKELKDEIVRLSKKFGIITPYTSYLILEDEARLLSVSPGGPPPPIILREKMSGAPAREAEAEYKKSMEVADGDSGVRSSSEIQVLNQAENLSAAKTGKERMQYTDETGKDRNVAEELVQVQGRAIYHNQGQWLDGNITIQGNKNHRLTRVQFNSDAYFKLLKENAGLSRVMALGKNVQVLVGDTIYDIYE